jgi:aminoglycoside phosphotransferase (APT) family kinase protein
MAIRTLGEPFARGRTAEIYPWEEGTILKLFRDWCPDTWIEQEAHIVHEVNQAGIPAPVVGDIVNVYSRKGIIYQRADGPDMRMAIRKNPLLLVPYAKTLARLQIAMHRHPAPDLPSQRAELVEAIQSAKTLQDDLRQVALQKLEMLPSGSQMCHGDFHPGNVILTEFGPVVIDWMMASRGHPAADVARTRLLILFEDLPRRGIQRLVHLLGRYIFYRTYLKTYRQYDPEVVALSDAYLPVEAAARLNEDIRPERERLIKMIR